MKIEIGKKYLDRTGTVWEITGTETNVCPETLMPHTTFVGFCQPPLSYRLSFNAEGKWCGYYHHITEPAPEDLIQPYVAPSPGE